MAEKSPSDPLENEPLNSPAPALAPESWQKRWRIIGGITIGTCAVMAGFGVNMQLLKDSSTLFLVYWGVFALLFFVTLYIVALDLRYIRAQHAIAERDLFRQTLGDSEFRDALREALRTAPDDADDSDTQSTP